MSENKEIKETNEKLENISEDEHIRKRAEMLARWEFDEQSGKAALIKYGEKQGESKWRKAEKLDIAKEMLKSDTDINLIKKWTGLSEDELEELKKEI